MWIGALAWVFLGCGLARCEELCVTKADCAEAEIDAYDSTWPLFTGFDDRAAYEAACFEVFEEGRDQDASRRELQKVCRAELERGCDQQPVD